MFENIKNKFKLSVSRKFNDKIIQEKELNSILKMPRFTYGKTKILKKEIVFIDGASFYFMFKEIFLEEIYKFNTLDKEPYIIDAGANIGLSIIYFKMLYPNCQIVAFEPDNEIVNIIKTNLDSFEFNDVEIVNKALSNYCGQIDFFSEGADGGRIALEVDKENLKIVECTSLKEYLNKKVDFLKVDIEGSETIVLEDCKELLLNVERIFVEYHSIVGQEQQLGKLINILETSGFRLIISSPGLTSANPFIKVNIYNNMDDQLNIYGIRL